MTIDDVIPDPFSNSFTLKVHVYPPLHSFTTVSPSDLLQLFTVDSDVFTINSVIFDPTTDDFIFAMDYSQNYQNQPLIISLNPNVSNSSFPLFSASIDASLIWSNAYFVYYDQ
jgi:hypothetical protein